MAVKEVIRQIICDGEAKKNPNFPKDQLEEVVRDILSRTSLRDANLTMKVTDYGESPKKGEVHDVKFGGIKDSYYVLLKVRIAGYSESWVVPINIGKKTSMKSFSREVKKSITEFNRSEKERLKLFSKFNLTDDNKLDTGNAPVSREPQRRRVSGAETATDNAPSSVSENSSGSKKPKKKRTRTADIVTDEVIVSALKIWMDRHGDVVIAQKEFGKIINVSVANQTLIRFLEKRGILRAIPGEKRKPEVQIAEGGHTLLRRCNETEGAVAEEDGLFEKVFGFSDEVPEILGAVQKLEEAYSRIREINTQEKDTLKKVEGLQKELAESESELGSIVAAKEEASQQVRQCLAELANLKVEGLFELAKQAKSQK